MYCYLFQESHWGDSEGLVDKQRQLVSQRRKSQRG
jgi:hypothetical protein